MINLPDSVAAKLRARFVALKEEADQRFAEVDRSVRADAIERLCEDILDDAVSKLRKSWPQAPESEVSDLRTQLAELLRSWVHESD